jgi:hypothetical protein
MIKDLPIYEIVIDLTDIETSVSFNSLVSHPAHEKSFQMFAKRQRFEFNDEEQVITGVAISSETPIFRRDESGEEYYVRFSKQSIKDIIFDYARRNNFNNVNLEHNPHEVIKGIFMIHSYQIDNDKGFTAPDRFKDENDGSWIVSYKVTDKEIYQRAKAGEFQGFSIEGVFNLKEIKMNEDEIFCKIYEELKSVSNYIMFYNDYPKAVTNSAKRGLKLSSKTELKCISKNAMKMAQIFAKRQTISLGTLKKMKTFLNKNKEKFDAENLDNCDSINFLLWGGIAGLKWAENKLKKESLKK